MTRPEALLFSEAYHDDRARVIAELRSQAPLHYLESFDSFDRWLGQMTELWKPEN